MTVENVMTLETDETMTRLLSLIEMQNAKTDAIILCLERLYTMGLIVLGCLAAVFVVMLLYNAIKKFL